MRQIKKFLFDVEKTKMIPGIHVTSDDGEEIEVIAAGKMIITIPEHDQNHTVYKLLEQNCGLYFYTNEKIQSFPFYPVPMLAIFAFDGKGNQYGTIGGIGGLGNDNYAVGFISQNGSYGKITNSFKEFLELVNFYPRWREILEHAASDPDYYANEVEQEINEVDKEILSNQHKIADMLGITKNPQVIQQLLINIRCATDFFVYNSKDAAESDFTFLNE